MLPDKDMTVQVQETKSIALKLKNLRFPLSEEYQVIMILITLPHEWSTLHTIILNKSGSLSLQDTIDSILEHETTLWQQQESVMIVHNRLKSQSPTLPNAKSQNNKKSFCTNCKNEGHNIAQCWSEGGGSEGKAPKWRKLKSDLKGKQKEKSANVAKDKDNHSPSPPPPLFMLHTEDALISRENPTPSNIIHFIVDSGASAHMCLDCSFYSSYWKINPPKHIWVADNHTIEAISVSDIKVHFSSNGHTCMGIFKAVLHLPALSESLLSTTKMGDVRITTILTPTHADLIHTASGKSLTRAIQERNLYRLPVEIVKPEQAHIAQGQAISKASLKLWHWRLGHISEDMIQRMASSGIAKGMKVDGHGTGDCSACHKGKQTRNPIPHSTQDRSSEILERVFSDLCGPMETLSIEGYQYFITFTDDYSCYTYIGFCKTKDDALILFKTWKACAEKETGKSLKTLRTDGGGEYMSRNFTSYLAEHGIKCEITNAYTPQENGVSECANRTISTLAHSMIADTKEVLQAKSLSLSQWPQAIRHAVWIKNRIPSRSLNHDTTPYQEYFGKKLSLATLHLFGCKAYAHVPKVDQTKLSERTIECVHVGFAEEKRAYLLWNQECRRLIESRDVKFEEGDGEERVTVDSDSEDEGSVEPNNNTESGNPEGGHRPVDHQENPRTSGDDERDVPSSPTESPAPMSSNPNPPTTHTPTSPSCHDS